MNITRTFSNVRHQNFCRSFHRKFRLSSIKYESSQASQPQILEEKFNFEDLKVIERTERRKAAIEPFMKNVFISKFDRELLAYPEVLNKEESAELDQRIVSLEKVFNNSEKTGEDRKNALKATKMYAAPINLTSGGLAANQTESLRYLDIISSDMTLSQIISDHWVGLQALKLGLHSEQLQQILDDITSGERPIALCIKEKLAQRITQADFRTTAVLDRQGIWRISGEKVCQHADGYYLVLSALEANQFKAFLVHPGVPGIEYDGTYVTFRQTPGTPLDNISTTQLARTLGTARLYAAAQCRNCLKNTMLECEQYVHKRVFNGHPLAELSTIRAVIGEALLDIYGSESAEYFTAGLLDGYLDPDAELEMAMCRNFMANHGVTNLLKLLAIPSLEQPEQCNQRLQEMMHLTTRGETLDSVNMFIALNGIHFAGKMMSDEIKRIRNPLLNPTFILMKMITNRNQEKDDPKLTLYLAEHLHPTLRLPSEQLEYCVLRMRFACETLMARHGVDVGKAYLELSRLAEAATEILAMTAVLARASRAYCIGLRNAEVEMKLAACFVEKTKEKVKKLILEIDDGEFLNLDHFKLQFGRKVLDSRSVLVEKPTTRVFW